ncbi:MAG: class I SAM-dependent methyltransferase [Candidatus Omnitrophica bacterium]|nr:class I SAM-dependent methyltransferase [Candidatus Omnitrophota bacterium]
MGREIDLLANYPKTKRDVRDRGTLKTPEDRAIARQFGEAFFDGERRHGYGGFNYNPRFWQPVIKTFKEYFELTSASSVLDVGCAKGFMLHDLNFMVPGITVKGVDVSGYAIAHVIDNMKPFVMVADAKKLPFADQSYDVVISINTIHNLDREDCAKALCEIERVSRGKSFVTVDAYRNNEERDAMEAWNLTAKTMMSVDEWKKFFDEVGFTGDYFWFIP